MPGERYEYTNHIDWRYLGPALRGIDLDLTALDEMSVAALQAGSGGTGGEPPVNDLTTVYNNAKA